MITPGPPWLSLGLYFVPSSGRTLTQLLAEKTPGTRLLQKCLDGGVDEWRRFKLITHLIEAPMALWATLGSVPIVAGAHCARSMHRTGSYHELVLSMGSSTIGRAFYSVFASQTEWCVLDCALLLEGQEDPELPEELLAVVHVHRIHAELAQAALGRDSRESRAQASVAQEEEEEGEGLLGAYFPSLGGMAWSPSLPVIFVAPEMPSLAISPPTMPAMPDFQDAMDCSTGRRASEEFSMSRGGKGGGQPPTARPQPR